MSKSWQLGRIHAQWSCRSSTYLLSNLSFKSRTYYYKHNITSSNFRRPHVQINKNRANKSLKYLIKTRNWVHESASLVPIQSDPDSLILPGLFHLTGALSRAKNTLSAGLFSNYLSYNLFLL